MSRVRQATSKLAIVLLLATCHRWLGEFREAYHYYSLAVLLEPSPDLLRAALVLGRGSADELVVGKSHAIEERAERDSNRKASSLVQ